MIWGGGVKTNVGTVNFTVARFRGISARFRGIFARFRGIALLAPTDNGAVRIHIVPMNPNQPSHRRTYSTRFAGLGIV